MNVFVGEIKFVDILHMYVAYYVLSLLHQYVIFVSLLYYHFYVGKLKTLTLHHGTYCKLIDAIIITAWTYADCMWSRRSAMNVRSLSQVHAQSKFVLDS